MKAISSDLIDWEGNVVFDDRGNLVRFKAERPTNNYRVKPISKDWDMVEDALEAKQILQEMMKPAEREEIALEVKKLSLHCGMQAKNPTEVKLMLDDYVEDLAEFPVDLIKEACKSIRKDPEMKFLPSTGEIIEKMQYKFRKLKKIDTRVKKILGEYEEPNKQRERGGMMSITDAINSI